MFGGRSTLSLLYAIKYPQNIVALVLRCARLPKRRVIGYLNMVQARFILDIFKPYRDFVSPGWASGLKAQKNTMRFFVVMMRHLN